jgi:acetoin utilization deacetylase AcuC-like enzyme
VSIFRVVATAAVSKFDPEAVVLQWCVRRKCVHHRRFRLTVCSGCDCLVADPLGGFNLSLHALRSCVSEVLAWKKPLVILGGGG